MIAVEFNLAEPGDWLLGLGSAMGEDENGEFMMFSIGFLFFSIDIFKY